MKKLLVVILLLTAVVAGQTKKDLWENLKRAENVSITATNPDSSWLFIMWDGDEFKAVNVDNLGDNAFDDITVDSIYYAKHNLRWDDLRFPATALDPQNKNDNVPSFDTTNIGFAFDKDLTEELYILAQMPHDWVEGTTVSPHVHWSASATDTVAWFMSYRLANVNGLYTSWVSDTLYATSDTATVNYHNIDGFTDIAMTGYKLSTIMEIKVGRIGGLTADALNADAILKEFDIHYLRNDAGSTQEFIQ